MEQLLRLIEVLDEFIDRMHRLNSDALQSITLDYDTFNNLAAVLFYLNPADVADNLMHGKMTYRGVEIIRGERK